MSPGSSPELLAAGEDAGIPFIPGVATATELMRVVEAGFQEVKLFPAEPAGGIGTVASLAAVFPGVRFLPTGGIDQAGAAGYLRLPAVLAVGGSWVCPKDLVRDGSWDQIAERVRAASRFVEGRILVTRVAIVGEPMVESYEGRPARAAGVRRRCLQHRRLPGPLRSGAGREPVSAVGDDGSAGLVDACREAGRRHPPAPGPGRSSAGTSSRSTRLANARSRIGRSRSPFRGALDTGDLLPDPAAVDVLVFSGIASRL